MKMDNYKAIAVAINSLRYNPNLSDLEIQSYELALGKIRDYMTQQETEKNEPLTKEEFISMFGRPVWIQDFENPAQSFWAIVGEYKGRGVELHDQYCSKDFAAFVLLGVTYNVYRRPPKEAMPQQETEKNEPLTLEELRKMIGQPVWCEDGSGNSCWCLVHELYSNGGFVGAIDNGTGLWDVDYYGMTGNRKHGLNEIGWYAYRHPPKEARNV